MEKLIRPTDKAHKRLLEKAEALAEESRLYRDSSWQPEVIFGFWAWKEDEETVPADCLEVSTQEAEADGWEIEEGWGARMHMPGYLDASSWYAGFATVLRAIEYLVEYHAPDEDDEEDEEPPPDDPLIGEVCTSALVQMREYGGEWFAYRNYDLSSYNIGHLKFLKCGEDCTFKVAPETLPDGPSGEINWRYLLEGRLDLETGQIRKVE